MSTTIIPAIGAGALFTQQGVGATPGYSAIDDRRSDSQGLQEGVVNASDFMVVQRGAGANMSVDIGMPPGGFACVQGDSVSGQGLYTVPVHSSTINEVVTTADATNPRIDQVILEVLDNVHDASGLNLARTRVLAGTPFAGTTLTSRSGVATLPGGALLLADILVGAGVSSVANTVIRDRRKWSRGAHWSVQRNGTDYTTVSTTMVNLDATNLYPRIECSGVPLKVSVTAQSKNDTANAVNFVGLFLDGAILSGQSDGFERSQAGATNANFSLAGTPEFTPAAGSHQVGVGWRVNSGTGTIFSNATSALVVTIEEILRQNTANNTTTSG